MKIRRTIIVISILFSFLLSTTCYVSGDNSEIDLDLSAKTFDELLFDMNTDSKNMSWDYSKALREKMETVSEERIIEEILDKDNDIQVRTILCNYSYEDNIELDYNQIKHLLFKETIPYSMKISILYGLTENGSGDLDTLIKLIEETDEEITIHAMNQLMELDFNKAVELADEIIDTYIGPSGYQVEAAVKVRVENIKRNNLQEEIPDFIELIDSLVRDEFEDHPDFFFSMLIQLRSLENKECIEYILHSEMVYSEYKLLMAGKYEFLVGDVLGDINSDNKINAEDALNVLKYSAGLNEFDSYQIFVGEVNGDNKLNAADALLILKYNAKIITKFPIFEKYDF